MASVLAAPHWQGEALLQTRDGSWQPVLINKEPLLEFQEEQQFAWIVRDLGQIRSLQEKLIYSENSHPLTHLPNRAFLKKRIQHCLEQAKRQNSHVGLLHIDLDQFRRINTSMGHATGDELLILVSQRLQNCTRKADTLAHLEGDDFVLLLEKLPRTREAGTVARRIIDELSEPFTLREKKIYVNISAGISIFPLDADDFDSLIRHAEEAMYAQKSSPESGYRYFDRTQDGAAFALLRFESDLRQAVRNQEFYLAFQPQVQLQGPSIRGVEALARWHSPARGPVSPRQFIPAAEKTGLINQLGRWVLEAACRRAAAWQEHDTLSSCLMTVNVSGIQLTEPGFLDQVRKSLDTSGLPPQCLELEITESTLLQEKLKTARILESIREMGVRVAIDDFGTGQSCLAVLKDMPVDTLKVDKKFLRQVPECPQSTRLLKTILDIRHAMDLETIIEGVETAEQAAFLQEQDCHVVQGFWCSPPVPEPDLLEFCLTLVAGQKMCRG
jgi:diguanylate cyclase (GGDEF)-like protein